MPARRTRLIVNFVRGLRLVWDANRLYCFATAALVLVADRIYVVEGGRAIESGSHDELIAHGGRYAELFTRR